MKPKKDKKIRSQESLQPIRGDERLTKQARTNEQKKIKHEIVWGFFSLEK